MHQPPTTYSVDGAAICAKRKAAGMPVSELAALIGCSANYLRKLERGTRKCMGPRFFCRLRDVLNATEEDLLV